MHSHFLTSVVHFSAVLQYDGWELLNMSCEDLAALCIQ